MRFEIRTGGTLLILAGLAVLSGAVFALGLIAGYEMSRQNQVDQSQLASVYSAPSPQAMPTAAPPPRVAAAPMPSPLVMAPRPESKPKRISEDAIPPPPAEAPPPPPPGEENPSENGALAAAPVSTPSTGGVAVASAPAAETASSAAAAAQAKRRAFNIQIDAVMDYSGAQQMAQRLRRLGYQPTIVQTNIAGQTWYRLRVGPYATAADARTAQTKLRQQYKTAFGSE